MRRARVPEWDRDHPPQDALQHLLQRVRGWLPVERTARVHPAERHLQALLAAEREDRLPPLLPFWGHTPRGDGPGPWVLSQWWPGAFTVDGTTYASAEHWMMAGKARLFGDDEALAAVLAARTPRQAKELGRGVRGFDSARWEAAAYDLVVAGNRHEFGADPGLRAWLVATAPSVLVEASPTDRVWGIGLAADDPRAAVPSQWQGRNLLGFALVDVRDELAAATG